MPDAPANPPPLTPTIAPAPGSGGPGVPPVGELPGGPPADAGAGIKAPLVLVIALATAVALADIVLFMVAYFNHAQTAELERKVVATADPELQQHRATQTLRLSTYGRSTAVPGAYQIPIDRAIDLFLADAPKQEAP